MDTRYRQLGFVPVVGIATLVCAARKAGAVHDLRHEDDGEFH